MAINDGNTHIQFRVSVPNCD